MNLFASVNGSLLYLGLKLEFCVFFAGSPEHLQPPFRPGLLRRQRVGGRRWIQLVPAGGRVQGAAVRHAAEDEGEIPQVQGQVREGAGEGGGRSSRLIETVSSRYVDVAKAYTELEAENQKVKNIMQQTQVGKVTTN